MKPDWLGFSTHLRCPVGIWTFRLDIKWSIFSMAYDQICLYLSWLCDVVEGNRIGLHVWEQWKDSVGLGRSFYTKTGVWTNSELPTFPVSIYWFQQTKWTVSKCMYKWKARNPDASPSDKHSDLRTRSQLIMLIVLGDHQFSDCFATCSSSNLPRTPFPANRTGQISLQLTEKLWICIFAPEKFYLIKMPVDIKKVLICDAVDAACVDLLKSHGIEVRFSVSKKWMGFYMVFGVFRSRISWSCPKMNSARKLK